MWVKCIPLCPYPFYGGFSFANPDLDDKQGLNKELLNHGFPHFLSNNHLSASYCAKTIIHQLILSEILFNSISAGLPLGDCPLVSNIKFAFG